MAMPVMNKIQTPDFKAINSIDFHRPGPRVVGHRPGAITTPERLMQFNTGDLAAERGVVASYGKGTNNSLVQFGGQ